MEVVRSIAIRVEIDTNKQTIVHERDASSLSEAVEWLQGVAEGRGE